jgi:hypothetical protein
MARKAICGRGSRKLLDEFFLPNLRQRLEDAEREIKRIEVIITPTDVAPPPGSLTAPITKSDPAALAKG